MIKSLRSKALADLWSKERVKGIDARMHRRILLRLDRLNVAIGPSELNVPGFNFHALKGFVPTRYTIHVNGPWWLTFEFEDGDVYRVDLEQYH